MVLIMSVIILKAQEVSKICAANIGRTIAEPRLDLAEDISAGDCLQTAGCFLAPKKM